MSIPDLPTVPEISAQSRSGLQYHILGTVQQTLAVDLQKFRAPTDLPTLLYHIKPVFQSVVERECAKLRGLNLQVVQLQDHFSL